MEAGLAAVSAAGAVAPPRPEIASSNILPYLPEPSSGAERSISGEGWITFSGFSLSPIIPSSPRLGSAAGSVVDSAEKLGVGITEGKVGSGAGVSEIGSGVDETSGVKVGSGAGVSEIGSGVDETSGVGAEETAGSSAAGAGAAAGASKETGGKDGSVGSGGVVFNSFSTVAVSAGALSNFIGWLLVSGTVSLPAVARLASAAFKSSSKVEVSSVIGASFLHHVRCLIW